ncbi:MAG: hypothetical protein JNJ56_09150 [Ignavibacteria bacterium]|nr:hypothetical protein [Ignavibacteria bacterium]
MKNIHGQHSISRFTIVKILKKLSPKEITELEKLLNSPFFNNHTTLIKLYRELKKYYPDFSDKKLTKKYLFEIINPGKKYDDKLFQKYLSLLNKLSEEYLSILELRNDVNDRELKVLYQLSKRDLSDVYSRKLNEFENILETKSKIDDVYYLSKHRLSEIKFYHKSRGNNAVSGKTDLTDSYNNLVNYFLAVSSSSLNQVHSNQFSYSNTEPAILSGKLFERNELEKNLAEIIKNTSSNDKKSLLFLELIQNDLRMYSGKKGLKAYRDQKKIIFENSDALSDTMLLYYLKRLNVYCIIENSRGIYDMQKDLFENYKLILEKKLFVLEGIPDLRILDYRVILATAIKNNELKWVEKFINESVHLIKEESRENIVNFGYAVLLFHKKNYSGSLDHISMINHELFPITVDIYILRVKIFYEMGFFDTAQSVAESLRHFIKNNRVMSDIMRNSLRDFYKYFTALQKMKKNQSEVKIVKLLSDVESNNGTWNKSWLIEKLNELRN